MSDALQRKWEGDHKAFTILTKDVFDELCDAKQFVDGPIVSEPSKWMNEFGPYNPHRWAFGLLNDGRYVCCDTTAKAVKEE